MFIKVDGRCSRCLGYVESTAGCQRCWPSAMSEAAESVICDESSSTRIIDTSFKTVIPVFQDLLGSVGE